MDDPVSILRMAERIVAVLIGGLAIYLGYRLFFHLPFEHSNKGELSLPGVKIVLSRVGPGVFFAAFGSAVLYYSLTEDVEISRSTEVSSQQQQSETAAADGGINDRIIRIERFIGMGPEKRQAAANTGAEVTLQQRSKALTTVEMLNCAQRLLAPAASSDDLQDQISLALRDARRALMLSVWDGDAWGPPTQLGVTGLADGAPFQLRNILNATYGDCPE